MIQMFEETDLYSEAHLMISDGTRNKEVIYYDTSGKGLNNLKVTTSNLDGSIAVKLNYFDSEITISGSDGTNFDLTGANATTIQAANSKAITLSGLDKANNY